MLRRVKTHPAVEESEIKVRHKLPERFWTGRNLPHVAEKSNDRPDDAFQFSQALKSQLFTRFQMASRCLDAIDRLTSIYRRRPTVPEATVKIHSDHLDDPKWPVKIHYGLRDGPEATWKIHNEYLDDPEAAVKISSDLLDDPEATVEIKTAFGTFRRGLGKSTGAFGTFRRC